MRAPNTKLPLLASLLCVIVGLLAGMAGASVLGALVAALGVVPACWGIWTGMQQQTQTGLLGGILLLLLSAGVAILLLVSYVLPAGLIP